MQIYYPDGQIFVVLYFLIVGAVLGIIYDVFKLKRVVLGNAWIVLFFDDLLFMAISAVVLVLCVFKANSGRLRWFEIFSTFLGFWVYRKTLSVIVVGVFTFVFKRLKALAVFLLMPAVKSVKKAMSFLGDRIVKVLQRMYMVRQNRIYIKKCLEVIKK